MKYDVFISYSSVDQKVAEGVCGYLESQGIRCFVAYRDIPRGVVWAAAIVDALDDSQMMVVIFSESFNKSKQVDREIELASENEIPILPFRISDTAFSGAKKYYLKNLNWIDAFPDPEEAFGGLCDNVKRLIAPQGGSVSTPSASVATPKIADSSMTPQQMVEKGDDYYFGRNGCQQNYAEAVKWYHMAAEQGYAIAQNNLGECYYIGRGVDEDDTEAVRWYRKAAEQGNADAQYKLGGCYEIGMGVDEDDTEAVRWYRKAAEQGNVDAQYKLGGCYEIGWGVDKDETEAYRWYRKAAEQGHAWAQYCLGVCYYNGEGVDENKTEAVRWYRKAAEQGNADAQYKLGVCYYNGEGVDENKTEAVRWFREVADWRNADAQYKLGVCYYNGWGVVEDKTEAYRWFSKAAANGCKGAERRMRVLARSSKRKNRSK